MTPSPKDRLQQFTTKPRVFVLSDISNEPDDAESLVRYLTYANQFITEGLVPTTSIWLQDKTCPEDMHKIVDGYAAALTNMNAHVHPSFRYPPAEEMRNLIRPGAPVRLLLMCRRDEPSKLTNDVPYADVRHESSRRRYTS